MNAFATAALSQGSPEAEDSTFDPFAPAEPTQPRITYGVMTDYEYNLDHKRTRLTLWSGPFYSQYEGAAYSRPKGWTIYLDYIDEPLHVDGPNTRTDKNYAEVDTLISDAVNAFLVAKGYRSV